MSFVCLSTFQFAANQFLFVDIPHLVNWLSYPPKKNKAGDPLCIDYPLSIVFSVTLTQLF